MMRRILAVVVAVSAMGACDDSTGVDEGTQVSVEFVSSTSAASASVAGGDAALGSAEIDVVGRNGTLSLETAHVILAELELERAEGTAGCDDSLFGDDDDPEDCEEIEQGPMFLELPLESGETTTISGTVGPGSYEEFEIEIEDLEDDEDDDAVAQRVAALLTEIRSQYAEWPREASMRVEGTFTPEGGQPDPFVVYLEAEIEIEMEFETPFVVTAEDASRTITVELDPGALFLRTDGTVIDLSAYDYDTTGQVLEFEVEDVFEGAGHDD